MPPQSTARLLTLLLATMTPAAAAAAVTSQTATPTPKTTVTTSCTTSSTTHNSLIDLGYPGYDSMTRIATATTTIIEPVLSPREATQTVPATVLETHMVTGTDTTYLVRSSTSTSTRSSAWGYTTTRTWVVHPFAQPGSTNLPKKQQPKPLSSSQQPQPQFAVPTPVCAETSCAGPQEEATKLHEQQVAADPRCVAKGMETACQPQQCQARRADSQNSNKAAAAAAKNSSSDEYSSDQSNGQYNWWCLRISKTDFIFPDLRMGRSCWSAANNSFMQLNTPCLAADYEAGCRPCRGRDMAWNGANWIEAPL